MTREFNEPPRLIEGVRGAANAGVSLLSNRLELLGVELAEERVRLLALLRYGAMALISLSVGIVFFAVFLTVLLWDEHRLLALGVFSALFVAGGMVALRMAQSYVSRESTLFAASLAELRKDSDALKPRPRVSVTNEPQ